MKPCCEDPANRSKPEQVKDDVQVTRCEVCDCRHFELTVDPGVVGIKLK